MKLLSFVLTAALIFSLAAIGCDDDDSPNQPDTTTTVKKPNIYIYPGDDAQLQVRISFPQWGKVIQSIPEYGAGWLVNVNREGVIDGSYSYLFYECEVPDFAQTQYGWLVNKSGLEEFFKSNLTSSGFNETEIRDFTDYWIPLLTKNEYYEIYPQYTKELEKAFTLEITPAPDNVYRLSYLVKGRDDDSILISEPVIEKAAREGFYVMEWGLIQK